MFTWWTVRTEPQALTSHNASGVSDALSMLGYVVAQMEQREDLLSKEGAMSGTFRLRASEVGLTWLVVAIIDELGAVLKAKKARADAHYQMPSVSPAGAIL